MLQRIKDFISTVYARRTYAGMVRKAEELHRVNPQGAKIAVITHPLYADRLLYLDKGGFAKLKREVPNRLDRRVSFKTLCAGAWYYTEGPKDGKGMTAVDREARRREFIRTVVSAENRKLAKAVKEARRRGKIKERRGAVYGLIESMGLAGK